VLTRPRFGDAAAVRVCKLKYLDGQFAPAVSILVAFVASVRVSPGRAGHGTTSPVWGPIWIPIIISKPRNQYNHNFNYNAN
jgi:hypothetical protein